jgi:hypothetical protein
MTTLVFEKNKLLFSFAKDTKSILIAGRIIILIFLLAGLSLCALTVYMAISSQTIVFDVEGVLKVDFESLKKTSLVGLFAVFFTAIPLFILGQMTKKKISRQFPDSFIFDGELAEFIVRESDGDEERFSFTEIAGLKIRSYTIRTKGKNTYSSTTYYVVCMRKKDGSCWDIYESNLTCSDRTYR